VLSGSEDSCLRLWDLEGGQTVRVMEGHSGTITSIVANWQEMQALSGADDGARLWDLRRGGCLRSFTDVRDGCGAVAADWASKRAVAGCGNGRIMVFNLEDNELKTSTDAHVGGVWAMEASWERQRLASGGDLEFKVWNTEDWTCMQSIKGQLGGTMCISVDWARNRALVGGGLPEMGLQLWNLSNQKPLNLAGHRDAIAHIAADWSERQLVFTGGWDAQLRSWNLEPGEEKPKEYHTTKFGRIRSLAVDFGQMQAICGASSGDLHVLDLRTFTELQTLEGHTGGVTALQASL